MLQNRLFQQKNSIDTGTTTTTTITTTPPAAATTATPAAPPPPPTTTTSTRCSNKRHNSYFQLLYLSFLYRLADEMAHVGQVHFTSALHRFLISRLGMTWVLCRALLQARCNPSSACNPSDVQHRSMHCASLRHAGPEAWEPDIEVYYISRKRIKQDQMWNGDQIGLNMRIRRCKVYF